MRALLDSHTFIWMADSPEKLSRRARGVCEEASLVLSVASVWELAIKARLGRLTFTESIENYVLRQTRMGRHLDSPDPRSACGSGRRS
ncbi:MAG TPA: hypothetical protein VG297_11335 [Bryobacteraceae bacterium]|jgi:PIN domain nuclease of toxin-antitoxin system|nr:hypothetical protein [Bryobacteraceae bacterium]